MCAIDMVQFIFAARFQISSAKLARMLTLDEALFTAETAVMLSVRICNM